MAGSVLYSFSHLEILIRFPLARLAASAYNQPMRTLFCLILLTYAATMSIVSPV